MYIQPEWRHRPWGQLERKPLKGVAGRGQVSLLDHPRGILVERAYVHGGLRRFFWPRWFWHNARASREFQIHLTAFDHKIPTVEPIGWREKKGFLPGWRRYWYYTVYLPGAVSLPQALKPKNEPFQLERQAAILLKALYELGIYHRDINLNNWLVWVGELRLIDFDRAVLIDWDPETYVLNCVKRILRSGQKLGFGTRKQLFFRFLIHLCRAFKVDSRQILNKIPKNVHSVSSLRKIGWKIGGGHRKA